MKLYTIGFTRSSAQSFFERLRDAHVSRVLDVRLHNTSQLAGFAKRDDLRFFLNAIGAIDYRHMIELAPTEALFVTYTKQGLPWDEYARRFLALLRRRHIERLISREMLANACLLCTEPTPHTCHRRLVAGYLAATWRDITIEHL